MKTSLPFRGGSNPDGVTMPGTHPQWQHLIVNLRFAVGMAPVLGLWSGQSFPPTFYFRAL
jgi:hypothetical protein